MNHDYQLSNELIKLVNELEPDSLADMLNSVFFDMERIPTKDEIIAVQTIVGKRIDAEKCGVALDICTTAFNDL